MDSPSVSVRSFLTRIARSSRLGKVGLVTLTGQLTARYFRYAVQPHSRSFRKNGVTPGVRESSAY